MSEFRFPPSNNERKPSSRAPQSDFYKTRFERMKDSRLFPITVVALSILIFGSIILYAYNQGKSVSQSANVPLIVAEADPFKIRPADPGGSDIPYQDSLAYEQIDDSRMASNEQAESLLPPPEQPMEKPAVTSNAINLDEEALKEQAENLVSDSMEKRREIASRSFEDPIGDKIVEADNMARIEPAAGKNEIPTPEKKNTTTKTQSENTAKTETADTTTRVASLQQTKESPIKEQTKISSAPAAGEWKVQLASFKDKAAAEAAWSKLKDKYAPYLNDADKAITRADLGEKGIYYRVNAANLSKEAAQDICNSIKKINAQGCLVVR